MVFEVAKGTRRDKEFTFDASTVEYPTEACALGGLQTGEAHPVVASVQRKMTSAALDDHEFVHDVTAGPRRVLDWISMPEDKGIWRGPSEAEFAGKLAEAMKPGMIASDIGGWHGMGFSRR